jgi:hypothetical protein
MVTFPVLPHQLDAISKLSDKMYKELSFFREVVRPIEQEERQEKAILLERYAQEHGIQYQFHAGPWVFEAKSGERIAMNRGSYMLVDGVWHEAVAVQKGSV